MYRKSASGETGVNIGIRTASAWLVMACLGLSFPEAMAQRNMPVKKTDGPPAPLVIIDPLIAGILKDAEKYLEEEDYKPAFRILDPLITSPGNIFYPLPDGRSYVSIRVKVNDLVGKMKPEGLKLYHTIYNPRAEQLYNLAMESGSRTPILLQTLADDYPHTSWGVKALQTLAAIHMDNGRFIQAAHCWSRALKSLSGDPAEPLLLAKSAVAMHLGGDTKGCQESLDKLKSTFPRDEAELGGKRQNLVEFVESIKARPYNQSQTRSVMGSDWSGAGSVPDGMILMENFDVILRPNWRFPEDDPQKPLFQRLCIKMEQSRNAYYYNGTYVQPSNIANLIGGHVVFKVNDGSGRNMQNLMMPPLIHPIIKDQLVIFRDDKDVRAIDMFTGQQIWKSYEFPLYDDNIASASMYLMNVDTGRMMLTAGQGMVFALGKFRSQPQGRNVYNQQDPNKGTGMLYALDMHSQGAVKWRIGNGTGDDDLVRNGRFISAPTYNDGRLYLISRYMEKYFLLCLRADTGRFIWKTQISMTPANVGYNYYGMKPDIGTPPAVANGKVVVATNSGVIAVVDAESGQPVWAYQYGSPGSSDPSMPGQIVESSGQGGGYAGSNPIIVTKGMVVCLPADSPGVVALNLEDGRPCWQESVKIPRGSFTELSAIDSERFLLSGGNKLAVHNIIDGERKMDWSVAAKGKLPSSIIGRPVVTPDSVMVSGEGVIYKVTIRGPEDKLYKVSELGEVYPDGLLGNLAAVDGNLIAANSAGVCIYFNYDRAKQTITRRLQSDSKNSYEWLYRRAHLGMTTMHYSDALTDYQELWQIADSLGDQDEKKSRLNQLTPRLYQTYIGLANTADSPARMVELFKKAGEYAVTDQDKGHLILRLARANERAGNFEQAAVEAQKLLEEYPQEDLANLKVGPEAETGKARSEMSVRSKGAELGRALLDSLIQDHGQEVYAAMDANAGEALEKARQEDNLEGIESVLKRWPFSVHADEARMIAGQTYMKKAISLEGPPAAQALGNVIRNLWPIANKETGPLKKQALGVLFLLYSRMGADGAVQAKAINRELIPDDTAVAFADMKGSLGDILKDIQSGKMKSFDNALTTCDVRPPLSKVFTLQGKNTFLLRDQNNNPIRLGESVFTVVADPQKECYIVLTDLSSDTDQRSERFRGLYNMSDKRTFLNSSGSPETKLIGGLSVNRDMLAIADRNQIIVYDLATSKIKMPKTFSQLGIKMFKTMACGEGNVVIAEQDGRISCIRMESAGQIAWSSSVLDKQAIQKIVIWGGMVAVIGKNSKEIGIFDLISGKLLGTFSSRDGMVSALPAGQGKIAVAAEKKLNLVSIEKVKIKDKDDKEKEVNRLKSRIVTPLAVSNATLLEADNDYAVLCNNNFGMPMTIVSLAEQSAGEPVKVSPDRSRFVVSCRLVGNSLYVLAAETLQNQAFSENYGNEYTTVTMLICNRTYLYKINPKDGKIEWGVPIGRSRDTANSQTQFVFSAMTVGTTQLSVVAKKIDSSLTSSQEICYIVDTQTGKVSQELTSDKDTSSDGQSRQVSRWNRVMPPAMTNGRLALDKASGLEVYGGQ